MFRHSTDHRVRRCLMRKAKSVAITGPTPEKIMLMMPLLIGKKPKAEAEAAAAAMLEKVGLHQRALHRPSELSGGERQRAAIARALVTQPKCLLADEPTGNLDRKNAQNILDMMLDLKHEMGTALVVVTHDDELAVRFDRVMMMSDGRLSDKA